MLEVDATHPQVAAMVEQAVAAAKDNEVTLPADTYIEVMEEAIQEAERDIRKTNPEGPLWEILLMFHTDIQDLTDLTFVHFHVWIKVCK